MSTLPLKEHSLYEREQLARINATPAAPESFDPIAALRRIEALADWLDGTDLQRDSGLMIAGEIRDAIAGPWNPPW